MLVGLPECWVALFAGAAGGRTVKREGSLFTLVAEAAVTQPRAVVLDTSVGEHLSRDAASILRAKVYGVKLIAVRPDDSTGKDDRYDLCVRVSDDPAAVASWLWAKKEAA